MWDGIPLKHISINLLEDHRISDSGYSITNLKAYTFGQLASNASFWITRVIFLWVLLKEKILLRESVILM